MVAGVYIVYSDEAEQRWNSWKSAIAKSILKGT
jgi:hypothetical protein